eukprot:563156-Pyramimonas_sp.AAC.1
MSIANLFCGQRREGDVQQAVETALQMHTPSFELTVLPIDILLDEEKGGLTRSVSVQNWIRLIQAGRILAVGGGPP